MSFTQIKRIKEIDSTEAEAIASYGSFVSLYNTVSGRIGLSRRRDWTPDRILVSKAAKAVPIIQEAIAGKFGMAALNKAINAHPFI